MIDWMYFRKNCVTCKKAADYLEGHDLKVKEITDARKERKSPEDALALAKTAGKIDVAKGQKVTTFEMKNDPPDDATLLAHLIGPTGNLRAPTVRKGKTLYVGFNPEAYGELG